MKKQVFSLMMVLAMVILVGTGAYAQITLGDGLTIPNARSQAVGSVHSYTIDNGNTYAWAILDATTGHTEGAVIDGSTVFAADAANYQFSPDLTGGAGGASDAATCYVQWLAIPANDIYIVEGTASTGGGCSTVRRFYISVFDFNVEVFLSDELGAGTEGANATQVAIDECNSWDADVVANSMSAADIAGMNTALINNPDDNEGKYTDQYFKVMIQFDGLTAQTPVDDIDWKFRWDIPSASGLSIYSIEPIAALSEGTPLIGASGLADGTLGLIGGTATAEETDITDDTNNWVYVTTQTDGNADNNIEILFRVRLHNRAGAADMIWDIDVSNAALEMGGADATAYNDGNETTDLTDNTSETVTISQSPNTSVIVIGD